VRRNVFGDGGRCAEGAGGRRGGLGRCPWAVQPRSNNRAVGWWRGRGHGAPQEDPTTRPPVGRVGRFVPVVFSTPNPVGLAEFSRGNVVTESGLEMRDAARLPRSSAESGPGSRDTATSLASVGHRPFTPVSDLLALALRATGLNGATPYEPSTSAPSTSPPRSRSRSWLPPSHGGGLGRPPPRQGRRAAQRLADAATRGAAAGLLVRGGLDLVSLVLAGATVAGRRRVWTRASLWRRAVGATRFALFAGSFCAVAVGVDEGLGATLGRSRTRRWRAMVAGLCAGPTLLLAGGGPHPSLATYLVVRASMLAVRVGLASERPLVRALASPAALPHADVAAFCAAVGRQA